MRDNIKHWKYSKLDLSPILYKEPASLYTGLYKQEEQDHGLDNVLDWKLLESCKTCIGNQQKVFAAVSILKILTEQLEPFFK